MQVLTLSVLLTNHIQPALPMSEPTAPTKPVMKLPNSLFIVANQHKKAGITMPAGLATRIGVGESGALVVIEGEKVIHAFAHGQWQTAFFGYSANLPDVVPPTAEEIAAQVAREQAIGDAAAKALNQQNKAQ
jgi:hypothetical protein